MSDGRGSGAAAQAAPWGFFFFLAYIGAAIYFISHSPGGFWDWVLGLLQALVWPVYLIYFLFESLGVA